MESLTSCADAYGLDGVSDFLRRIGVVALISTTANHLPGR